MTNPSGAGRATRRVVLVAALLALAAACGKKAPLRLPEQQPVERAHGIRAEVRERRVVLEFRVPSHRTFPEREEPWVLARILRKTGSDPDFTEAGTLFEAAGFPFDAPLSWTDEDREPGVSVTYRVEFRDGRRRRRALSPPLALSWPSVPGAPRSLEAVGAEASVKLGWQQPEGATGDLGYRVYRRAGNAPSGSPLGAGPLPGFSLVDTRVDRGREYCYSVRAVLSLPEAVVEGPPGEERCATTVDATPPSAPEGLRASAAGGAFLLTWQPVSAPDLAGYVVYRACGEGTFERVAAGLVQGTAYRDDPGVLPGGTRCRWVVTALDNAPVGNESAFSAPAEAETP